MNLCDSIFQSARHQPDHPALIEDTRIISYRELAELTSRWSSALQAEGLQPGDRAGICLRDSADFVIAMLACAHAGITIVPMDWRAPAEEVIRLAGDLGTAAVLREPNAVSLATIRTLIINEQWQQGLEAQPKNIPPATLAEAPLILNLTSGTTGKAKGAVVSHQDYQYRLERSIESLGDYRGCRYLSVLPLCFGGGSGFMLYHLSLGNTVIVYPTLFSAQELVAAVREYRADFLFLVPTVLRWLLDLDSPTRPLFPDLRVLLTGTAPISAAEKVAVADRLCPNYWEFFSTSATGRIASLSAADMDTHAGSVGQASERLNVEVVDKHDQPLPAGESGRLRCRGPGISAAYFGDPDQTNFSDKILDGWYYTGDIAHITDDGFVYVAGRADDMIIRGGENIHPGVVENVLLQHPQIGEAAVKGRASRLLGQEPVAYVVVSGQLTEAEILTYCRDKLRPNQVPVDVRLLPGLPKTAAGKVQKRKLPD